MSNYLKRVLGYICYIFSPFLLLFLWITRPSLASFYTAEWWIKKAYRKGKWDRTARLSHAYLILAERFSSDWNYGNAIHNGNQFLGLVQLRKGNVEAAKEHLLAAGRSPGSPQLDSFGPAMVLARELCELGERLVVIEYVDLVAKFWTMDKPHHASIPGHAQNLKNKRQCIQQWKSEIAQGQIPDYYLWHQSL